MASTGITEHAHISHVHTAVPVTGFRCNLLYVSLDVHPPALECGVHGEVHDKGVDAAVVVVNEHRVSGDLPACGKPAHTRGQEEDCQGSLVWPDRHFVLVL